MAHWNAEHIPDQSGRVAIVTGANSGLGYETTRALARKGARVVMACRNLKRGQQARDRILQRTPGAALDLLCLLYTSPSPRDRTRSRMPSSA